MDELSQQRELFLSNIEELWKQITILDDEYRQNKNSLRKKIAEEIERGRLESDLQITSVANRLGITRQSINRILIETYGIRHPDKAEAAKSRNVQFTQNNTQRAKQANKESLSTGVENSTSR